jgi:Ser/Thr protein kinase RdoA (MazF antagonist)
MAAFDALARIGVDTPPHLDLLRFGENALYGYPQRGLVVRVARPSTPVVKVGRTLEFVTRLAAAGMPMAEPVVFPGLRQPVVTSTGIVSLWVYYDIDRNCRVMPRELGGILRRFHDLADSQRELVDPWEPFELIRPRLDAARRDGIDASLLDPLGELLATLEVRVPGLTTELGVGVIHGDSHYGNVMCLPGHNLILIDFDQIACGPREWDLVPSLVTRRRFGMSDEDYDSFSTAYGYDLRTSPHAPVFIALRELGMVTWLLQQYGTSAEIDTEIHLRVATINERGARVTQWRVY